MKTLLVIFALLAEGFVCAQESAKLPETPENVEQAKDKAGMEAAMKRHQEAWNKGDVKAFLESFHPTAPVRAVYQNEQKRERMEREFKEMVEQFGPIQKFEVRKFIDRKNRYVVRIEYSKKGMLAGTYTALKLPDGGWAMWYMNIDGQGEPELKE
jgi:hypothetical protein